MISLFRGAGLLTQLLTVGAIFAGAAVGYIAWKHHQQNIGWNKAIAAIAAQDKVAVDAAIKARSAVRACYDSGGVWDAGTCKRQGR